jgi:hypothetical protein
MALELQHLDGPVRALMAQEIERDLTNHTLYLSPRLTAEGRRQYPALLRQAAARHDDAWLATELRAGLMAAEEQRRKPSGGFSMAKVPVTAPEILAEGEFNRFYCRALCLHAIESGLPLEVYRAKPVANPRPESQAKLGNRVDPQRLLEDLRTHPGVEPALGLPPGPNSGLSIRLVDEKAKP